MRCCPGAICGALLAAVPADQTPRRGWQTGFMHKGSDDMNFLAGMAYALSVCLAFAVLWAFARVWRATKTPPSPKSDWDGYFKTVRNRNPGVGDQ